MTIVLLTKEFNITGEQSSRCGGFESYIWKDVRVRKSTKGKGCGKTQAKSREGLGVLTEAAEQSALSAPEQAKGSRLRDPEETPSEITEGGKQPQKTEKVQSSQDGQRLCVLSEATSLKGRLRSTRLQSQAVETECY